MATETTLHCWQDGQEDEDGMSTTCMLPAGHKGPHEWTRDDSITIAFADGDDDAG